MAELLGRFFVSIFGTHSGLATMIISMFPLIELKGGIPIGMSVDFWGEYALRGRVSFALALLGSCLVCPLVALVFKPILNFLKNTKIFKKLAKKIEKKVQKHSDIIDAQIDSQKNKKTNKTLLKCILICLFVAVPLPVTGVWTGTCVSIVIGLNFWQTILSVVAGNCIAGLLIVFVCSIFPEFTTIIFYIVMIFIICILLCGLIKSIIKKIRSKKQKELISEDNQVAEIKEN